MTHQSDPTPPEELDDDMLDAVQGAGDFKNAVKSVAKSVRKVANNPAGVAKAAVQVAAGTAAAGGQLLGDFITGGGGREPKSGDGDKD